MQPFEMAVRKFVHQALLKKDARYQRLEYVHMSETSGHISVKWIDREGRTREDTMAFTRKV